MKKSGKKSMNRNNKNIKLFKKNFKIIKVKYSKKLNNIMRI